MTFRPSPLPARAPASVRVTAAVTDDEILQARRLCYDTYVAVGYLAPSPASAGMPDRREGCTYLVAKDDRGSVVGTLRLSVTQPCEALRVWQGRLYPEQALLLAAARRGLSFEMGALAVCKDVAAMNVSGALYRFAYRWALAQGRDYGVICMDVRAFRALRLAAWYAVAVGTPLHYLGSLTVPAIIPIRAQPLSTANRVQAAAPATSTQMPRL